MEQLRMSSAVVHIVDDDQAVRESLGAALLRAGEAGEAESVFRDGVKRSPRNGRMLFGLMQSLRAQQKNEDAEWVKREFDAAWAKADVKLTIDEL